MCVSFKILLLARIYKFQLELFLKLAGRVSAERPAAQVRLNERIVCVCVSIYIYIYIYHNNNNNDYNDNIYLMIIITLNKCVSIYIYIYRERERYRDITFSLGRRPVAWPEESSRMTSATVGSQNVFVLYNASCYSCSISVYSCH